mmetsp:Transcript_7477/g.11880  ORF Transcript_7477/g.11880 Transcript_7477/m.11880 type:complete len:81 (-) Transcript_7477:1686-1928(-)
MKHTRTQTHTHTHTHTHTRMHSRIEQKERKEGEEVENNQLTTNLTYPSSSSSDVRLRGSRLFFADAALRRTAAATGLEFS